VLVLRSIVGVPAFLVVGGWFLFQLGSAYFSLSSSEGGGVAYGAHIGGFLIGMPLVLLMGGRRNPVVQREVWGDRLN